ncbi:hypothetical protein A3H26_03040 [candidate division WWE3 bacterium RIFCSPLOWO2_12_FULL_36_10]|uniref:4Fe-4S ferredoxin-type domain-containing protein n=1 Tax=candidate division WWE3 bacterium RIFCSPLOWO2_12_FULL_36_10 TaxID=1802630 RepID=A0A1F4VK38_UNCKA|nr:MAG: hypothetical protein A3H26_03040 [candidate division WWE3 bacterium RIFCSPLOWO2_12_FULL_36_10]
MAKILKVKFPEKCNGCELCVMEVQRQLGKIGLDGSLIRILRENDSGGLLFVVDMDPKINEVNIEEIVKICPTGVFEISDLVEENNGLLE